MLDRGKLELGVVSRLLQFLGLFYPESLFVGSALLKLSITTLRLFKLDLQPGHLVLFFLELGLVRNRARNLAILQFGCAEMAELAYKVDTSIRE